MRKHIVAGNWKMNLTFNQADELLDELMSKLEETELPRDLQVIVCPPFPYIDITHERGRRLRFFRFLFSLPPTI